jgi:hypothetical protein
MTSQEEQEEYELLAKCFAKSLGGSKDDYLKGFQTTDEALTEGRMSFITILESEGE